MIIWLASYPRSGNTFSRSVFNHFFKIDSFSMHQDRFDIGANPELASLVGHRHGKLTAQGLATLRNDAKFHVTKTHDGPSPYMAPNDYYLHMLRDGRDSAVSYCHYLQEVVGRRDVDLARVISGQEAFGTWGEHTLRWTQFTAKNLLRVRFEEVRNDPVGFAQNLSDWLGIARDTAPFPDIERFRKVAPDFIRAGAKGSWRMEFTDTDTALFSLYNQVAMRLAGYSDTAPTPAELDAYSSFCANLGQIRALQRVAGKRKDRRGGPSKIRSRVRRLRSSLAFLRS